MHCGCWEHGIMGQIIHFLISCWSHAYQFVYSSAARDEKSPKTLKPRRNVDYWGDKIPHKYLVILPDGSARISADYEMVIQEADTFLLSEVACNAPSAPPMHHHVVFKSQPRLIFKLSSLLKVIDTYNVIGDNQPQERNENLSLHFKFSEVASGAKLA